MSMVALQFVKYRVLGKVYSKWRAILAESGSSDTDFLVWLRNEHDLIIDKAADPMLYLTQDTEQTQILADQGTENPTLLQIMLTSRAYALTEEACKERWLAVMQKLHDEPVIEN